MMGMAGTSGGERRERILEAARYLALRHGLRGVTMEAIAREARIAKPTLYSYFPDKEAVFLGVMEELAASLQQAFDAGLAGPGDVVERIGRALAAKHAAVSRLLEGSAHADALYSEHDRAAGPRFRALEARLEAALADALAGAGVAEPLRLAQLLMAAAAGLGARLRDPAALEAAIRLLAERLLRPELSGRS